jgi:hypothetical protein
MVTTGAAVLIAGAGTGAALGGKPQEHLGYAPKSITVSEKDGQAVVTIARSWCDTQGFWEHHDVPAPADEGSATKDADYTPVYGTEQYGACGTDGEKAERTVTIPILDDDEQEPTETINLGLYAYPTTSDEVPMPDVDPTGSVVIQDDDTPAPPPPPVKEEPKAAPAPAPKPVAPAVVVTANSQAVPTPRATPARRCASRRSFSIRLRPANVKLRSAVVTVDGSKISSHRSGGRLVAAIDLRNKAKKRYTVKVVAKTADGRTIRETRRYRTCTAKRKKGV